MLIIPPSILPVNVFFAFSLFFASFVSLSTLIFVMLNAFFSIFSFFPYFIICLFVKTIPPREFPAGVVFTTLFLQIEILVFFYDLFRRFSLLVVSDPHDQED